MEYTPLSPVVPFLGYRGQNTAIPSLYWNEWTAEQRIRCICEELRNVECYAADLGVQTNLNIDTINELGEILEQLQNGGWFDEYAEQIQAWIEDIQNLTQLVDDRINANPVVTTTIPAIQASVAALEMTVSGEDGLESRMSTAEDDIDTLEATVSGEGGLESRITTAEADIDALEDAVSGTGGLESRMDAAEADIDAIENGLSLEALRNSIPDTLHEATPLVRVPVDFVSATVQTHPQGFTTFGGTPEEPVYAAVYQYHRVDTTNGANTVGTLEVWRLSDQTKVASYSYDFGHGNGLSTDWTGKRLFVAGHSHGSPNVRDPRVYVLSWTESGTLARLDTVATPFTMVQSAGVLPSGEYWVWAPYESGIYTSETLSTDLSDWKLRIPWVQSAMGTGLNQSAFYAEALRSFAWVYASSSCIVFADDETGAVWRTMQIDPALGFIDTEELEGAVVVGTRLWLCNSPVYDTNHNGVLNEGAEATIWTVDLPRARNYKEWSSTRAVVRWTYHVDSSQSGLPTADWTNPGQGGGRVDLANPRDLIGLEHYPGEKVVYIDTPYPTRVLPFINSGFVILSGPSNANLVNGNQCETLGGLYMYGQGTYVTWFGWNTGTGIQITPEAVANWPQVYNNRPTWIRMTYFPTLNMRGATATKTATDNSVWIGGEDGKLEWPNVSTKTEYMYMLRALLHDSVTAQ